MSSWYGDLLAGQGAATARSHRAGAAGRRAHETSPAPVCPGRQRSPLVMQGGRNGTVRRGVDLQPHVVGRGQREAVHVDVGRLGQAAEDAAGPTWRHDGVRAVVVGLELGMRPRWTLRREGQRVVATVRGDLEQVIAVGGRISVRQGRLRSVGGDVPAANGASDGSIQVKLSSCGPATCTVHVCASTGHHHPVHVHVASDRPAAHHDDRRHRDGRRRRIVGLRFEVGGRPRRGVHPQVDRSRLGQARPVTLIT